uniref:Ion transport domain-containing protein n=1 Tax=Ciona savignyi TaxID=51511 RepID=H2YFL8_CIOSA
QPLTWFERVSMLVILLNCVPLGLYQPCQPKPGLPCGSPRCSILEICDHFVFAFFAIEMLIKMLAMGVWGKLGYLGEAWNRLDFFIVLCGMMEYTLQLEDTMNFTSVRTVRVLRPLRAINRVPNMRILVMLLLDTLPMLGNVLMLCSFVFFIFGVVAVQLWEGTLRQRCFLDPNVFNITGDIVQLHNTPFYSRGEEDLAICSLPMDSGEFHCSDRSIITPFTVENITCSNKCKLFEVTQTCTPMCIDWNQYMNTCKAGDSNPSLGSINFDNIMYAWVAIFQVISLEGWVDIMYYLMDGYSFYSFIYFILLIVIGSFFMINLCLVVIATQFSETKQREQRLMEEQRLRFKSNDSTLASYSPPGNCYEEMLKYISHLYRKNKRKIKSQNIFFVFLKRKIKSNIICAMLYTYVSFQRRWHKWQTEKKLKRSGMGSLKREVPVRSVRKKKKSIHLHHHHHHHHHHYHIADTIDRTGDGASSKIFGELMDGCIICTFSGLIRTLERRDRGLAITSDACPHTPQNFTQILPQRLMLTDGSNELVEPVKTGKYKTTQDHFKMLSLNFKAVFDPLLIFYIVSKAHGSTFVLCSFIFNGTNDGSRFVLLTVPIHTPSASTSLHSICGAVGIPQRTNSYRDRRPSAEVTVNDPGSVYFKPRGLDPCFQPEILSTKFCPEDITVYHYNAIIIQVFFIFHSLNSIGKQCFPTDILGKNNTLPRPQSFVTSELNCSCAEYEISNPEVFEPGVESDLDEKPPTSYRRFLCCCCDQRETKGKCKLGQFKKKLTKICQDFQEQTKRVVDSSYFNRGIMIAILINTLSMGIEHHSQPDGLTEVLEISNVIFTTLFALEMIAKIVAFGVAGYTKNLYNVFDALIVIIRFVLSCVYEFIWEIAAGTQNSGGGLSVLRTFRLLRVLKLVRFMPALQRQLVVLMKTMDNVATFMMLLTLFIFIFSILGMHLFGCDFCWVNQYGRTECDRKNFDSLLWAFVTVFQILTQEDWNIVLYNGMAATSPFASIYFITLMTIGNYVLFSLLVAILVEGFQAEYKIQQTFVFSESLIKKTNFYFYFSFISQDGDDEVDDYVETSSDEDEEVELLTRGRCPLIKVSTSKDFDEICQVSINKNVLILGLNESSINTISNLCLKSCCSTSVEIQRADDDSDSEFDEPPILAENYTKKVAKALGITGPKNVNGNTGHARKKAQHHMHVRIIALVEFSSMVLYLDDYVETSSDEDEEVELLTRGRCPLIKVSTSKGGFYFCTFFLNFYFYVNFNWVTEIYLSRPCEFLYPSPNDFLTVCSPSQEKESENWSLPVITRTSATPLHTPTLANISQENSLEKSFLSAESRGSSTDSQTEKDANHNTPQSVKKHAILSRKPSTESQNFESFKDNLLYFCEMLFAKNNSSALNLQTNCRTNKGILITTKSRKNHHFITKYFLQSCLSISSVIKFGGGSPLSRTGSWRLRKLRKIPTDQQSLVCSDEGRNSYYEIEEDMYSNASFENEYKEREEITKNSSTGFQDCSNKAIPSHNQNNNNSVLTNENTTNTNEKTEITSSKSESTGNSTESRRIFNFQVSIFMFIVTHIPQNKMCYLMSLLHNVKDHVQTKYWLWQITSHMSYLRHNPLYNNNRCKNIIQQVNPPNWTYTRKEWSLYLFSPELKFRRAVQKITEHKVFDNTILLLIFGNCITIAMERPSLKEGDYEREVLDCFNNIFTFVFLLELILKVIASGFYVGPKAYLKSGWNVLDFFLVSTSLIDFIMTLAYSSGSKLLGMLRVFRLLRALRPLRVISRAPGLKLVVQTLISSLKPIGNIVLICCAFFIIFGILGVQVLKGKFYRCVGPDLRNVTNKSNCLANPNNNWVNRRFSYQLPLNGSLKQVFLTIPPEWLTYTGFLSKYPQLAHLHRAIFFNEYELLEYLSSFSLILSRIRSNLATSTVHWSMRHARGEQRLNFRRKTLSRAKNQFSNSLSSFADNTKYYEEYGPARRALHDVCMNKYFEIGISIVIGINILTMAAEHYKQPKVLDQALKIANYFFTAVFILEAVLKLIALGFRRYFRDRWNQVDMLIVILSVVGIAVEALMTSGDERSLLINPTIIRVMRVLRIARVLKLLKVSKGIRSLLETVGNALPQVGNLGLLFLLLFFIFAALGVELFGTLSCDEAHPCNGLSRHASFSNFGIALLTLFRISTGDNWNGIMKDTIRQECDASDSCMVNCCSSSIISPIYFVLFVMTAQFVLVNVVVAVLMK